MVITANTPKFDKRQPSKGAYDAIVYIDGSQIIAEDSNGRKIASGVAGTDDATVIQTTIDLCGEDCTIYLNGHFVVALNRTGQPWGCIRITENYVRLIGINGATIDNQSTFDQYTILIEGSVDEHVMGCAISNIKFLHGNDDNGFAAGAIWLLYANQCYIHNITSVGGTLTSNGCWAVCCVYSHNNVIENIVSIDMRRDAILSYLSVGNTINNINVIGGYAGIRIGHESEVIDFTSDNIISNVIIQNVERHGLTLYGTHGNKVQNMSISNAGYSGVYIEGGCENQINNLHVDNAGDLSNIWQFGIQVQGTSSDNTISNFMVKNSHRAGIWLYEADRTIIFGGCVKNNNTEDVSGYSGIAIQESDGVIISNVSAMDDQTSPTQVYGIRVYATATKYKIQSCQFSGNKVSPILLASKDGKINGCDPTENSGSSTGTGSEQTIAHGLVSAPTKAYIYIPSTGEMVGVASDATNIYPNVPAAVAYNWHAEV